MTLNRNIEKFKFPGKISMDHRKQIISLVGRELKKAEGLNNPKILRGDELDGKDKEFLTEHFLTHEIFPEAHQAEAFVIDDTGCFLTLLNIRDHIQFHVTDITEELELTWNKLVKMESALGKSISYSYSPIFGFLTADPFTSGTGLIITAYLQLTGLIHSGKLEEAVSTHMHESVEVTGLLGNAVEFVGDLVLVRNKYTLGVNEENILASIRSFVTKMLVDENGVRNHLKHEENDVMKDKVSRAFAILVHSYQIEAVEALNAIGLLKLGLELGWIKGTTFKQLNALLFVCRRAHLLDQFPEKLNQEQIPHKRAEFIHKTVKEMTLLI
jgi:protein arginine kinase